MQDLHRTDPNQETNTDSPDCAAAARQDELVLFIIARQNELLLMIDHTDPIRTAVLLRGTIVNRIKYC